MRSFVLLACLLAACSLMADQWRQDDTLLSLMKEDEALPFDLDLPSIQVAAPLPAPSLWGARFGFLYPGSSSETGNFITGPLIGGYFHLQTGPGSLELTLDLSSHRAPRDVDRDYQILLIAGAGYLYKGNRLYAGGGLTLANASAMNNILMPYATCGMELFDRVNIGLNVYIPVGNTNNKLFTAVCMGYRF